MNQSHHLTCSDYYQHLLEPVSEDAPCGEALDYDSDFILLQSHLQPRLDTEYGSFFEAADPINWAETERNCMTLLEKSRDIRLVVILIRCQLRKKGIAALAEGIEALIALLRAWPDDLHPQLLDEGEFTPMLRGNAIAELEDINGLLMDFRHQPLPKAAGLQITIKEFEKAHQIPREEGALSDEAVSRLINDWHDNAHQQIQSLGQAESFLQELKQILEETLGQETPELNILSNILSLFKNLSDSEATAAVPPDPVQPESVVSDLPEATLPEETAPDMESTIAIAAAAATSVPQTDNTESRMSIHSRADAIRTIQAVRHWFTATEPSSPLVHMLRYAEESIGKNFAELVKMYPPEIIAMLSQEKE